MFDGVPSRITSTPRGAYMQDKNDHTRVLLILAKGGGPVRKSIVSQHTWRWADDRRTLVLQELHDLELIDVQVTPNKFAGGRPNAKFIWLTVKGLEEVSRLVRDDVITKLPADWRDTYGSK